MCRWVLVLSMCAAPAAFAAVQFIDAFARPDGLDTEWVQVIPIVRIESERLVLEPDPLAPQQPNAWAGKAGVPIFFGAMTSVSCTIEFGDAPLDAVGRHGGLIFCGTTPTDRYNATFSGYFVDWIDRVDDHGFRVFRVDNGVHTILRVGTPAISEPPSEWSIVFHDAGFELSADGTLVFDIADTTYRGGYFGCWCYSNVPQRMYVDDMVLDLATGSCPILFPAAVRPRMGDPDVVFDVTAPFGANDAGPFLVTVASTDPAVATVGGAASVDVVFEQGGVLTKSFTLQELKPGTTELRVTASGAPCDASMVPVEVVPAPATHFLEDFSGESDGAPEDCLVAASSVMVNAEELHLMAAGAEPHAWLGHRGTALDFSEIARIDCKIRWGEAASAPILRHGGLAFCAEAPTSRWSNPNYTFDYIERDQTFRIGRGHANGTQTWLAIIGGRTDPGIEWSIELTGATLAFLVDGEKIAEVVDTDLRSGYIGFWCYSNAGQEMFVDDIEVVFTGSTCSSITPAFAAVRPWYTMPVYTVAIPFGANFTEDYAVTVKSTRSDIARPLGADAAGALALVFPAGGGMMQTFDLECFDVAGTARLDVVDAGAACTDIFAEVEVLPEGAKEFSDDFTQADGPPGNWTVPATSPAWQVAGGMLENAPSLAAEADVWAGNPAIRFEYIERFACTLTFGDAPLGDVGRHGGIMFYAREPLSRGLTSGYTIDWIDRITQADHGYRFLRFDNGVQTMVLPPTLDLFPDPGAAWEIAFNGDEILFSVDGELVFDAFDSTYRDGYIGAWVHQNESVMRIDDVVVGAGVAPPGVEFTRGDINADGKINIGDAIAGLAYLFTHGPAVCVDAVDTNDDGKLNIADPITLLQYQFTQGEPPPPPFDACGEDGVAETPDLGCESFPPCAR